MKKLLAITLTIVMLMIPVSITAFAEDSLQVNAYVTISDKDGKLVLTQEKITVTDIDSDNKLTLNDALYCAHEAKYEGGAAAGYASSEGTWGLSLDKLWGTVNGGSYGYYINNQSSNGLRDEIAENDYINAYIYTDLTSWSDKYCYFDKNTVTAKAGEEITLTLSAYGYDANWAPVVLPVENATVTLNGEATEYKTDASGNVTFTVSDAGEYVISAVSDTEVLVPPVCKASISAAQTVSKPENNSSESTSSENASSENASSESNSSESTSSENKSNSDNSASNSETNSQEDNVTDSIAKTGDSSKVIFFLCLLVASLICIAVISVSRKADEK